MELQIDPSRLTEQELDELLILQASIESEDAMSEAERVRNNERMRLQADFTAFVKTSWPILEPGNKLVWSWHYDLIAEYLLLAAEKKCTRLIINIPPRTLKSILITIMFPVWVWTRTPNQSFACASYAQPLSEEHSVKRRRLLESDWFRHLWGDRVWLQKDQNQKSKFQNNYQAQMFATSVGGTMQGIGGAFLIVDDGLKADDILSDPTIIELHNWFDKTWRQRLNDPATDVMIIVEQRTGERDITGFCLDGDKLLAESGEPKEWTHLCIPMEADDESVDKATLNQRFTFPISGRIKDRPIGDVLQPDRFTPAVIAAKKVRRLTWETQEQGRPSPLEGNMIKRSEVMYYGGKDPETGENDRDLPKKFDLIVTSCDAAFKDTKTSDFVCVGTIGVLGPDRFILEVVTKHLDAPATEKEVDRQRIAYKSSVCLIEDKANGSAIIKSMRQSVTGVVAIEPEGGKISRMYASCGEWQSHNWYVSRIAAWTEPFVEHITKFPGIKNDDDVDMMTQACVYIRRNTFIYGLTEYLKNEAEMAKKKVTQKAVNPEHPVKLAPQDQVVAKVESPTNLTKPDIDDKTPRCAECGNTHFQRIPGGQRCSQCGTQVMQNSINKPATTDFGMLRK